MRKAPRRSAFSGRKRNIAEEYVLLFEFEKWLGT
jgi:hypothetical protein